MATAKLTAIDVQTALGISDEGVRDLVRRGLLHPETVGERRPIAVYDAVEVHALAGARANQALDRAARRQS